jgi:hypothetical protein
VDAPKSLASAEERRVRLGLLDAPHVAPLTRFVMDHLQDQPYRVEVWRIPSHVRILIISGVRSLRALDAA